MNNWHRLCITDRTGAQWFKCTASPMSTASEIKNLQGHIQRAQKNPKAYAFLDVASAHILLDNVPYGPCSATQGRLKMSLLNTVRTFRNGNTQSTIEHARAIMKNLGVRAAAGHLRNKGYSLEAALWLLLSKEAR